MNVFLAGGLGFVGGHIAQAFIEAGHNVTVVDACLSETGGGDGLWSDVVFQNVIRSRVQDVTNLTDILREADLIVDSMGWTRHMLALKTPEYDLDLNVSSHLHLIGALPEGEQKKIIYLGSRGQYGNPKVDLIDENTPQIPEDIQGIHKVAAESYWRQISRRHGHSVISLRFGNSYGVRQPMQGSDIGLLGGFIRSLISGETLELYGRGRTRPFINVQDVAQAVLCCGESDFSDFNAFNLATEDVGLEYILDLLIKQIGRGDYKVVEFPKEEKMMDVGNAVFSGEAFKKMFPNFKTTPIDKGLISTIEYITKNQ